MRSPDERRPTWLEPTFILVANLIYALPYLANWKWLRTSLIPPSLSDDVYYYLNVSRSGSVGTIVNPWFGNVASAEQVPHLRFGLTFRLFHLLQMLCGDRNGLAVFVWNVIWTTLIVIAAIWLARTFGLTSGAASLMAISFLMFANSPTLLLGLYRLARTFRFSPLFIQLPFYRTFSPQVAIPMTLLYAAIQFRALRERRLWQWIVLVLIQGITFAAFPYAALMMTAASVAIVILDPYFSTRKRDLSGAAICVGGSLLADALVFLPSGSSRHVIGLRSSSPFEWNPSLPDRTLILISIAVMFAMLASVLVERRRRSEGDATAISFGLAFVAIIWTGDVFIARGLEVSVHTVYLAHIVMAILLMRFASNLPDSAAVRRALAVLAVVCVLIGAAASLISMQYFRPVSRAQGELVDILRDSAVGPRDLAIAAPYSMTQETVWIPLVTHSQVLFDSYAQLYVPVQEEEPYWNRLTLFLYLSGKTSTVIAHDFTSMKTASPFIGRRNYPELFGPHRQEVLATAGRTLVDSMRHLEADPQSARRFFAGFNRVIVIERVGAPLVDRQRLSQLLCTESSVRRGDWIVTIANPCR
jgi:hypothetical protein